MDMRTVVWVRRIVAGFGLALVLACGGARADDAVRRGPQPAWVQPAERAAPATADASAEGVRFLLFDQQVRAEGEGEATYVRLRTQAQSPQALAVMGSVALTWNPASQSVTVHHVSILREGQTIDALDGQTFETLRREQNLEQAILDGRMTAVLQLSGLRVGDILDVAYTTTARDPVTGGHFEQTVDLNPPAAVDRVRYRASWPASLPVRVRAADDWTPLRVRRVGDQSVVEIEQDGIHPLWAPDDAPARFHAVRRIELTDYRDWADIAVALKPLYDTARALAPTSPLHAEIERIRALSDDDAVRAAAALRLVQDQVRYVALVMGEGALTPAGADETWNRRFGDCKAKTALLLALLDGLGIAAEPAAVSMLFGDGMDRTLPRVAAFDHVLVRAEIDGRVYWLDGARTGDRTLEGVRVPPHHWALPLTGPEAGLEALTAEPLTQPEVEVHFDLDASAGLYVPATVAGRMILRGDGAALLSAQLTLIASAQRDQVLRAVWADRLEDATIAEAASAYDVEANTLTLTMRGTQGLEWRSQGLIPPGVLYPALTTRQRPDGPFRDAPYAVPHPTYAFSRTTLRLPEGGRGFRVSGGETDLAELGHHILRTVRLDGDTVTVDLAVRSLADEITAAEADAVRPIAAARPYDPPRVFAPVGYRPSADDRTAIEASRPSTATGWLARAFALSRAGDWAAAEAAADEAVLLEPDNASALANRGVYRLWTGDRDGAAADLERAVDIDPAERIAMNGHALLAMARRDYAEAVVELSRALRQAPGDDFALRTRAQAYAGLNQYDRALRDIDTLIAANPDDTRLALIRIALLDEAGRAAEANAEMEALAEAAPSNPTVLLNLVALKLRHDDPQAAFDIADRLLTQDPAPGEIDPAVIHRSALARRAEAGLELGRLDSAKADIDALRALAPDDAMMLNNLCWLAATAGALLDQGLSDCEAARALEPESPTIMDSHGRVLLQRGDAAGALAAYDAALAKAPDVAVSLYGRGLARIALGRREEGEADRAAAVALDHEAARAFRRYLPAAAP